MSTRAAPAPIIRTPSLAWALAALFLRNAMNYVDRLLFGVTQELIKKDLGLSDFKLGLLGGPAFAILYIATAFPIARIAERGNRVTMERLHLRRPVVRPVGPHHRTGYAQVSSPTRQRLTQMIHSPAGR